MQRFGQQGFVMRALRSSYDMKKVEELEADIQKLMNDLQVRRCGFTGLQSAWACPRQAREACMH